MFGIVSRFVMIISFSSVRTLTMPPSPNDNMGQIDLNPEKDASSTLDMIDRECRLMMSLSHPNIVRLQEVRTSNVDVSFLAICVHLPAPVPRLDIVI